MNVHSGNELVLFGGGPQFGLPEVSPYVIKTEVQLQLAGLPYRKERAQPGQGPKGQIPFITHDGRVIGDSTFIRVYLEQTFGLDLDAGLTAVERAQAWAVERMAENQLGWCGAWTRFLMPENFEKGPKAWFAGAPQAAIADFHQTVATNLRAVGVGRHSPDEITALGVKSLSALSTLLADKPFLFGDQPTSADATVFGILITVLNPFFDSKLQRAGDRFPNLGAYIERMLTRFYPAFAGVQAAA